MTTQTYNALEGQLSVRGAATSTRTAASNAVALVGGYDSDNAASEVTAGEETFIENPSTAEETFGDSEIPIAAQTAAANGVGTIYGIPVPETETTESFGSSSTGSVANTPLFNPNLHPDHDITITDTVNSVDLTVNVVHDDTVAQPSESETANINPNTGEWAADASSDYDITYTYGDYATSIQTAVDLPVRYVVALTEDAGVKSTLVTELSDVANDFDFKRGVVGAKPEIGAGQIGSYTPNQRDWRLVEVAPALGAHGDDEVRTCAALGGFLASQPIGPDGSGLYDPINGLTSLNTEYRSSEAKDFEGVTSLNRNGTLATTETTSDEGQFRLIYATEIIDDVALDLFSVARDYAGGPQDVERLETLLEIQCQANANGQPPNLGFAGEDSDQRPYDVNVTLGSQDTIADAGVTIVPYPIAETVNINITVADGFVEFGGAN
jgi:hypothetical protein